MDEQKQKSIASLMSDPGFSHSRFEQGRESPPDSWEDAPIASSSGEKQTFDDVIIESDYGDESDDNDGEIVVVQSEAPQDWEFIPLAQKAEAQSVEKAAAGTGSEDTWHQEQQDNNQEEEEEEEDIDCDMLNVSEMLTYNQQESDFMVEFKRHREANRMSQERLDGKGTVSYISLVISME